jgi:hypothetical protein
MEASVEEKSRRLIRRMNLTEEDAELWTGMLAKMTGRPGFAQGKLPGGRT